MSSTLLRIEVLLLVVSRTCGASIKKSEPLTYQDREEIPGGSCVLKGPYVLKFYKADMDIEAY
jgi:hypothetical protein